MTIATGTRLGAYEIVAPLGAGGMGEVYRARDTKLSRDVAIKVLPDLFAADPERLARFQREAQVLAALNHSHIAQIYGLEESPIGRALVMELVEGEDLAHRLARGPLPVDEALDVARQIAGALEAAHDRGIIHRDLKPANVMITPTGDVKVLDFGLAKALAGDSIAPAEHLQTITSPAQMTHVGVILGTAAYMSPEQAKGRPVDKRVDIWAFGCLLYEMLTGARLFQAESVAETIGVIVTRDADLSALPAATPARVRELMERCLQRDPRARLRDIGDARLELERAIAAPRSAIDRSPVVPATRIQRTAMAGVALLVMVAAAGGWLAGRRTAAPETPPSYSLRQLTELPGPETHPDISPDGRQLIYASAASGNRDIYLLRVGGQRSINLTAGSAADDDQPAFAADGQSIAFRSEREGGGLFIMGATGESVRRVTTAGHDPAWSPDGRFLAYSTERIDDPYSRAEIAELWTVEIASGSTRRLLKGDAVQPVWSPTGQRIAYWANERGQRDIWTVAPDGTQPTRVTEDAATDWSPCWSADGSWLYFSSDRGGSMNIWRVRVDPATGRPLNDPQPVTSSVRSLGYIRRAVDDGRIVAMAYDRVSDLELYAVGADGQIRQTTILRPRSAHWCSLAPDASWIACSTSGSPEDIILLRPDGSDLRRLTGDAFKDRNPVWHPDGQSVAFFSTRTGGWEYWSIRIDGSGLRQLSQLGEVNNLVWSPDGLEAIITAQYSEVWRLQVGRLGTRESATRLTPPAPRFYPAAWSASGARLAGVERSEFGDVLAVGVWDTPANRYRRMRINVAATSAGANIAGWLPDSRRFIARSADSVVLVDADADTSRVLLRAGQRAIVALSRDGRTLLVEREAFDGDIWMLEREGAAPSSPARP